MHRFERLRSERQQAAAQQQRQQQQQRQTAAPLASHAQQPAAPDWPLDAPQQPQYWPLQQASPPPFDGSSPVPGRQQMTAHDRLHSHASNPLRQLPNGQPPPDRQSGVDTSKAPQQLPSRGRHALPAVQLHSMTDGFRDSLQRSSQSAAEPAFAGRWGQVAALGLCQSRNSSDLPATAAGNISSAGGQGASRPGGLHSYGDAQPWVPTAIGSGGVQLGGAAVDAELRQPGLAAAAQRQTKASQAVWGAWLDEGEPVGSPAIAAQPRSAAAPDAWGGRLDDDEPAGGSAANAAAAAAQPHMLAQPAQAAWDTWLDDGVPAGGPATAAQPRSAAAPGAWGAWLADNEPAGGSAADAAGGTGWPVRRGNGSGGGSASAWVAAAGSLVAQRPNDSQLVLGL